MRACTWKAALLVAASLTSLGRNVAAPVNATRSLGPARVAAGFMRLSGTGVANPLTGSFTFAGTGSVIGPYSAEGTIDLNTFVAEGTLTNAAGDTLAWRAQFAPVGAGIEAAFEFVGGTGGFEGVSGAAVGPVFLASNLTFTFGLRGTLVM